MSGHTPGPWEVENLFGAPRVLASDAKGSFPVCDVRGWGHLTGKGIGALGLSHEEGAAVQDANARLIAAAPDLLKALEEIAGGEFDYLKDAMNCARTALAVASTQEQSGTSGHGGSK